MNNLAKLNDATDVATVEQQIEQHAQNIERIQRGAIIEIGRELSEAQTLFAYSRNEGGFTGWLAARLPHISQASAYEAIRIFQGIGPELFMELHKLSDRALLETAAAEPDVKAIIAERVEAGEIFTAAQVKEIKEAAAKEAESFKASLQASEQGKLEADKAAKLAAEQRIEELQGEKPADKSQPSFDAAIATATKAKQDEIESLRVQIDQIQNDPTMKAMRKAVEDAARNGGKKPSSKNPDYVKPSVEYDEMMKVVGSCRMLLDRTQKVKPATILAGFYDAEHRTDGLKAITGCRDFLNRILEAAANV